MNTPLEHEMEKASNSYLMSLLALIVGVPLPIVNLIATLIFFLANRNSTYFVRWHCTQALISQLVVFFFNSYGFWWTVSIMFGEATITNEYVAYIITIGLFNIIEFVSTLHSAIAVRKGHNVRWLIIASITDQLVKQKS